MRALCDELEIACRMQPASFSELIPLLQRRVFDVVVASLSITEDRQRLVDFTRKYYVSPNRFVVRRDAAVDPADLAGRTIGVERGSSHARYVSANYVGRARIRQYGDLAELFVDLALDRLDVILVDTIAARERFLDLPLGADFAFVGPELDDPKWFGEGVEIAVRKGDTELRDALNEAILRLRANGRYDVIRGLYFNYDIYGD